MNQQPLSRKQAIELANALGRLSEIQSQSITSPSLQAEARGLVEHCSAAFLSHGPELMGCWFVVRDEYEPIVNLVARITGRVRGIFAAAEAQAKQVEAAEPSNIITP
jgi:hypothetical protein